MNNKKDYPDVITIMNGIPNFDSNEAGETYANCQQRREDDGSVEIPVRSAKKKKISKKVFGAALVGLSVLGVYCHIMASGTQRILDDIESNSEVPVVYVMESSDKNNIFLDGSYCDDDKIIEKLDNTIKGLGYNADQRYIYWKVKHIIPPKVDGEVASSFLGRVKEKTYGWADEILEHETMKGVSK